MSNATCAGCCLPITDAYSGGIWLRPNGTRVIYALCELCTIERKCNPQEMMDAIELNLSRSEGRA